MNSFEECVAEQLKDSVFCKEYEALEAEFNFIQAMIDARKAEQSRVTEQQRHSGSAPSVAFSMLF